MTSLFPDGIRANVWFPCWMLATVWPSVAFVWTKYLRILYLNFVYEVRIASWSDQRSYQLHSVKLVNTMKVVNTKNIRVCRLGNSPMPWYERLKHHKNCNILYFPVLKGKIMTTELIQLIEKRFCSSQTDNHGYDEYYCVEKRIYICHTTLVSHDIILGCILYIFSISYWTSNHKGQ